MTNEERLAANGLAEEIKAFKNRLAAIESNGGVNIRIDAGGYFLDRVLSQSTLGIFRTIVEAELMDQLEKLESQLEAL